MTRRVRLLLACALVIVPSLLAVVFALLACGDLRQRHYAICVADAVAAVALAFVALHTRRDWS